VKGLQGPSETQTKTTPQLKLAAHLKADAINIAQALKITEEHGKDTSRPAQHFQNILTLGKVDASQLYQWGARGNLGHYLRSPRSSWFKELIIFWASITALERAIFSYSRIQI